MFFFSTGGAKFNNAERTIIFIHGAGMDRTVWSMQARFFAHHGFTVVNLDLPGHGKSEGPACATIEEYSDWLNAPRLRFIADQFGYVRRDRVFWPMLSTS